MCIAATAARFGAEAHAIEAVRYTIVAGMAKDAVDEIVGAVGCGVPDKRVFVILREIEVGDGEGGDCAETAPEIDDEMAGAIDIEEKKPSARAIAI